jgi:hypothetical protein
MCLNNGKWWLKKFMKFKFNIKDMRLKIIKYVNLFRSNFGFYFKIQKFKHLMEFLIDK